MHIPLPPPQWRIPIAFVVALAASTFLGLPLIVRGLLFALIVVVQSLALWRRFGPGQPGKVTYWRGVRYETKRDGSITLEDIQDNAIALLTWLFALLLTITLLLRFFGF